MGLVKHARKSAVRKAKKAAATRVGSPAAGGMVAALSQRAIDGSPAFDSAKQVANRALEQAGTAEGASALIIRDHTLLAGAQGFLTQLGGPIALPFTLPANIAGLLLVELRMVAALAHVHGHDLDDPTVRLACLSSLLGGSGAGKRPSPNPADSPSSIVNLAQSPSALSPARIAAVEDRVARSLVAHVIGKRALVAVAKRVPVLGSAVAFVADGYLAHQTGTYAAAELAATLQIEVGPEEPSTIAISSVPVRP